MFDQLRTNLILLVLNIIALGNFAYTPTNQLLFIFLLFIILPLPYNIKNKMKIITIFSISAAFATNPLICQISCMIALGIAVNTAYQLDLSQAPVSINTALGLSQIISFLTQSYLLKNSINRDIILLIFTLPNLFFSCQCQNSKSRRLYLINPFLDDKWIYSVGFILGIFTTNFSPVPKHYKFYAISLIVLLQASFGKIQMMVGFLTFFRGLLVYTQHIHESEKYFLIGYLVIKIFLKDYLFYFMFIGYLIIAVILHQQYNQRKDFKKMKIDQAVGTQEILQNDCLINNMIQMKVR